MSQKKKKKKGFGRLRQSFIILSIKQSNLDKDESILIFSLEGHIIIINFYLDICLRNFRKPSDGIFLF